MQCRNVDGYYIKGEALGAAINRALPSDPGDRADAIASAADAAGIEASTLTQIINGTINCPPLERLRGIARSLGLSAGALQSAAERDGCNYDED